MQFSLPSLNRPPPVKMTTDLRSMSVELLQREIRKVAARIINRSASLDELDHAWATLRRLQDALALEMERAKGPAD